MKNSFRSASSVFSYASLIRKRNAFFMQRISVKKHCRNVPLHAPISHPYPPVCCGIQPLPSFLMRLRTIFLRSSQRFPQSLFKPFLSQKLGKQAYSSVHPRMICQNKSTPVGRLHLGLSENQVIERLLQTVTNKYRPNLRL